MIAQHNVFDLETERIAKRQSVWRAAQRTRKIYDSLSIVLIIASLSSVPAAMNGSVGVAIITINVALLGFCRRQVHKTNKWEKRAMRE